MSDVIENIIRQQQQQQATVTTSATTGRYVGGLLPTHSSTSSLRHHRPLHHHHHHQQQQQQHGGQLSAAATLDSLQLFLDQAVVTSVDAVVTASTQEGGEGSFVASLPPPLALAAAGQSLSPPVVDSGPQGGGLASSLDVGGMDVSSDWLNHGLSDQLVDNNQAVVHPNSLLTDEGPDDEIEAQVRPYIRL